MANNDKNDKELNSYLDGNSELSKKYRASNSEEPPAHLDDAILSAAKEVVARKKQKPKVLFHKSPWAKPVSIAAIITLSVSLVVTMQQQTGQPLISEPASDLEIFNSSILLEEKVLPQTVTTESDIPINEELEVKKSSDLRSDVPAAALGAVGGYREESKVDVMKDEADAVIPAQKSLSKEKISTKELERRVFSKEQALESVPMKAELDDVVEIKETRQRSQQEDELAEIKNLLFEGKIEEAKALFEKFNHNYPGYPYEVIEEVIGKDLLILLK